MDSVVVGSQTSTQAVELGRSQHGGRVGEVGAQLAEFQDNVVTERPRVRQRVGGGGPVPPHADVGARRIVRVDGQ